MLRLNNHMNFIFYVNPLVLHQVHDWFQSWFKTMQRCLLHARVLVSYFVSVCHRLDRSAYLFTDWFLWRRILQIWWILIAPLLCTLVSFFSRSRFSRRKQAVRIRTLLPRLHSLKHMPVSSDCVNKQVCVGSGIDAELRCQSQRRPVSSEQPLACFFYSPLSLSASVQTWLPFLKTKTRRKKTKTHLSHLACIKDIGSVHI